ncbi:MAG TPA: hypothetical protein VM532_04090, partial [Burkholderiales bacterium]|nr:hypothetical protein [Burkholderiales bacterium]
KYLCKSLPAALPLQGALSAASDSRCAGSQHAARNPCLALLAVLTVYCLRRRALLENFGAST